MGEDDIVELLWKSGQVVQSSQTQRPSVPPPILRGTGSGGVEGNAPLTLPQPPPPLLHHQQPYHQSLFIHEDEMASWLHHPHREGDFYSDLIHPGVASTPATQPLSSVSLPPPPPPPPPSAPYDLPSRQIIATRRVENFMNLSRLRGNIFTGSRVEAAGPLVPPVVRQSTQVGSSATHSTESRATAIIGGVSHTFVVPGLGWKENAVSTEIAKAGTSSSGVSKAETEPIQIQPATETETETADDRKLKEREETADKIEETKEVPRSTSRKRSRAAEMHNISERRRREKINEKMKTLQELIPHCNKSDKASMLDDVIEYVKWSIQMQIQMVSTGMMPMMYTPDMQRFMPHMAMGMNWPPFIPFPGTAFPRPAHMAGQGPSYPAPRYPFPNIQAQQPDPAPNQPQFPGYLDPYSQFVGLHQMQQPLPPLQNQTTAQLSFSQASSSKEPEDQENQPTGSCVELKRISSPSEPQF